MRSNFRKTTITILLVLCMAVSVFAVSAFAEDANSTSTNADSTSVNHTCERKVVKYTATQAAKYIAGDNTYPELEGYLFAGWYNNEACTKAGLVSGGTPSGEEAFALYIPEHVLSIQAQVSANLMDEQQTNDGTGSLRFITSVDSLLYKQVGFEVYYTANGVTRKATSASNKVYSKLYEMDSENVWEKTPSNTFCNLSKYFKICTLKNFTMQTFMETEFTVKPYWITMDGDKVYGVEATKKFSEGCLRDTVWVSNDGTDAPNFGDYNDPYATLDYAISHVEDGGTVRVKDDLTIKAGTTWTAHGKSVTITDDDKDTAVEKLIYTADAGFDIYINDEVTFTDIEWTLPTLTTDDTIRIFAQGNHIVIKDDVKFTEISAKVQLFGGSNSSAVESTHLEVYSGTYSAIFGGSDTKDVLGDTKVIVGGNVNSGIKATEHSKSHILFGAGWKGTVYGDTNIEVQSGAKFNYIFGGGDDAAAVVKGSTNINFAGEAMSIYGGSASGNNTDTHVVMTDGYVEQIFGGSESASMTGNTDVQVLGGTVARRIYGGCYNNYTWVDAEDKSKGLAWKGSNFVNGYTSVTFGSNVNGEYATLKDDYSDDSAAGTYLNMDDSTYYAVSRSASNYTGDAGKELGVFIVNNYSVNPNEGWVGETDFMTKSIPIIASDISTAEPYHYLVQADVGGTVYSAGDCIRIALGDKKAATVTIGDKEVFYTTEKESYYPLPSGHDASTPIVVTFGDTKDTILTEYKAKIGSSYYLTLDEAIKAADKMKDADIETINGSTDKVAKITVLSTENGTVTSSCKNCVAGETVTFDVAPDEGYNLVSLVVKGNDTETTLNETIAYTDATYTFTTSADVSADYTVEAVFKKKVFKDNTGWDLSAQHSANDSYDGKIVVPSDCKNDKGNSTWLELSEMYTDIDITLSAKCFIEDKTKESSICVQLAFDNGKNVNFRLIYKSDGGGIQSMNGSYYVWGYPGSNSMSPEEITAYKTGDGVDYRLVRLGSMLYFYIGERQVCPPVDLTNSELDGTGENTGITADMPATVSIRCDGNVGAAVEHSFIIKDNVQKGTLTIKDSENGKVAASKTDYFIGDKITLTPEPNDAYNCASLMVDGKEVELTDGAYTFTATDICYEVEAVFAQKIFDDGVEGWDISKQHKAIKVDDTTYEGYVSIPGGGTQAWLPLYGEYTDIDLTLRVKDYVGDYANGVCEKLRQVVWFEFDNEKTASFSITYTGYGDDWSYQLQSMNDTTFGWNTFKKLTDEQIASYQDEDGIEFRVLRYGSTVNLYLDGELVCEGIDLTQNNSGVTDDMPAKVSIRNDDNATDNLVIPFNVSSEVDTVSINIDATDHGAFTTPKKNYLKGETVVVTVTGDDGYYYNSFKINGQEVIANYDGTYSFVASETAYEVTGSFAPEFITSNSGWDLINQNVGIVRATYQNGNGNTNWLFLQDQYTNIDVTMTAREYPDTVKPKLTRTALRLMFTNGQIITFSIAKNTEGSGFKYSIQALSEDSIVSSSYDFYVMNQEEINKFNSEEGIEFRVIRTGTTVDVYLGGVLVVDNFDLTQNNSGVTADMKMDLAIRRFDDPFDTELPLTVSSELPQKATVTIPNNIANGSITTDKEEYIVGEKVTLTVAGDTGVEDNYEDDYYYKSLIVNGKDVTVNNDGTYTFIAQEENTIEAKFEKTIFKTNALTYWNLTNQHKGILVQRGGTTYPSQNYFGIDFAGTHTDSDVSVIVKENSSTNDTNQNNNRTTIGYWKSGSDACGFSIVNNNGTYTVAYSGGAGNGWGKVPNGDLTEEEQKMITQGDGLEFRLVRIGALVKIYANGRYITNSTLPFDTGQTLWIRQYDDAGAEVEIPYTMSASAPETASITILTDRNGTVTTDKETNDAITDETYIVREKVTLTAIGKDGYYCNSLTVNGEEVQPNWDGTYTFTASEKDEVYATFAEGPFADNGSNWNLSRQNYGVLVPLYEDGYNSDWVDAYGNYTELNITAKDYLGKANSGESKKEFSVVGKFTFDNGKWAAIRIINEQSTYKITQYGGTDALTSWNPIYTWNQIEEQKLLGEDTNQKLAKIETDGIEFKLVRSGARIEIWLAGTLLETLEFDGITADNTVTKASIRHYGNPTTDTTTYEVEVPFSLVKVDPVALTLVKNEHGVVTTNADNYFVGDTVTATVSPDAGYVCDTLKVNGSEVALSKKGTYTFEATDEIYELEPVYERKIFVDSTAEWNVTNQYNGSIVSNSDGDSPWLYMYDYYENMDFTITAKDKMPSDKNFRLVVQFTFENGKYVRMSITNDNMDNYIVQSMQDSIGGWNYIRIDDINSVYSNCVSLLQGDGLEMRVVRTGLKIEVYLNNVWACEYEDLSLDINSTATGITENMKAKVSIRHYGNNELDIEMPFTIAAENTEVVELHDTDLFYANNKITDGTDPFILDNTAIDRYYYMYSTQSACCCYRSKDLMNWEYVGNALNYNSTTGIGGMLLEDIWAPEVVYDATDDLYYMFFSATPTADKDTASQVLFVATSKYPYKGFELVDFKDESSCGVGNMHDYDTSTYSLD